MKVVSRAGHLGLKILRGLIRYQIGFEGPVKWDESGVLLVQAFKYDFFLLMEYVPGFASRIRRSPARRTRQSG